MVGPNVQDGLFSLIVRFRTHMYAITADIENMYRQVEMHPDDRKFQKILWRENPNQPVKTFTLNTVTSGISSASVLATRPLTQLSRDAEESHPLASNVLREDIYMDDVVTGAETLDNAKLIINELIKVTKKGGMNLRQRSSNEPELIETLTEKSNNSFLCLNLNETTKTLCVHWNPRSDSFTFLVNQSKFSETLTLSLIAQLFDPLGLLGPVILHATTIMQSLWLLNLDWDEFVL